VDQCQQARELLVSRRAKLTPAQANLPAGTNRRVPGLRRSEVAALAGVSIEYYAKLERGLELAAEPGLTLTIYTAEPGSPSQQALRLLDSWASTPDQARAVSSDSDT
jgi:transcriptional regulator with XRE-family HTH domain